MKTDDVLFENFNVNMPYFWNETTSKLFLFPENDKMYFEKGEHQNWKLYS